MAKNFYTAIDLGTTNSVFAYGNITQNDKLKPIVLDLDRKNEVGSTSRNPLLPSVVFYYKNKDGDMKVDVGDYAKSRYGTRTGYVCKSVKSLMGLSDRVPLVDEIPDKKPSDVSAQILSYMVNSAKKRLFQKELQDVIITVPASFDSDQCQATLDAAEKAGIQVKNTMHDVLLYEPKAVIYDFIRMQDAGEIPPDLISLDVPKNVMVFDLGGGTLDVTLHKVAYSEEGILNIQDIAISRYSQLGGDNFDELLAQDMLMRFEEDNGIKVSIKRREEVMCKLRKLAEKLKVDLSMAYQQAAMSEIELPEDYELDEVMDINLYDSYAFASTYNRSEIEEIIAPLMGHQYKKEDADRIQRMDEKDINNIIYPILDVLDKAGKIKIDAVILNGGMSKFYLIKNRLSDFFGFEMLETSDPDLSVARGAVYYHYCLHKFNIGSSGYQPTENSETAFERKPAFNISTILNDNINLGLRGEYVSLLIPAGTQLPYRSDEIRDKYKFEHAANQIGIEMFLGRGISKNLPNRRIATRILKFGKVYPENTPISFRLYINAMRMMTMEAWITGQPETKAIVDMDMASLKSTGKTNKGISTTEKLKLNAKSEINELKSLSDRNKNRQKHDLNHQISKTLAAIKEAANPEDFYEPCMSAANSCLQSDMMLGYIYSIAADFKDHWKDAQKKKMLMLAKEHFNPMASTIKQNSYVLRQALDLIAVLDPDFVTFYAEYLTRLPSQMNQLKQSMFQSVILHEKDDARVADLLTEFFKISDLNKWVSELLIKRYGRGTPKDNHQKLSKFVKMLIKGLQSEDSSTVPYYLPVLIAELCCDEGDNPLAKDKYTIQPAMNAFKHFFKAEDGMYQYAVMQILQGISISEEENAAIDRAFLTEKTEK